MQRDFRFSCKGCGKCCDSPPQLSIREMYEHLDDFVLFASIVSQPVDIPPDRRISDVRLEIGRMISRKSVELGSITFVPVDAYGSEGPEMLANVSGVVQKEHIERCPALSDDNRCSIYETRPNTCRYVPGQHLLPVGHQDVMFRIFKERHKNDCDWSETAPLVVEAGDFCDAGMSAAAASAEADDRLDAVLFARLLDLDEEIMMAGMPMKVSDGLQNAINEFECNIPVAAFTVFLRGLRDRGGLPEAYNVPSVAEVARRQRAVCERLIDRNLRRKDRSARSATDALRAIAGINRDLEREFA